MHDPWKVGVASSTALAVLIHLNSWAVSPRTSSLFKRVPFFLQAALALLALGGFGNHRVMPNAEAGVSEPQIEEGAGIHPDRS
jgi:hypothetical protein